MKTSLYMLPTLVLLITASALNADIVGTVTATQGGSRQYSIDLGNLALNSNNNPDLFNAIGSSASGTLTAQQMALLPNDFLNAYQIADNTNLSVGYKANRDHSAYDFTLNYTGKADAASTDSNASTAAFFNIADVTGGPPDEVSYGSKFPINVTVQMQACSNQVGEFSATFSTAKHQSEVVKSERIYANNGDNQGRAGGALASYVASGDGGAYYAFNDYQDLYVGDFVSPAAIDSHSDLFDGSKFKVLLNLDVWQGSGDWMSTHAGDRNGGGAISWKGDWNVKLAALPVTGETQTIEVAVKAKPSPVYKSWFMESQATKTEIVVPAKTE